MTFERGIWAESLRNFWLNKLVVLTAVVILAAFSAFEEFSHSKNGGSVWIGLVWLPVAAASHATILKGQPGFACMRGEQYRSTFLPFTWRSLLLSFIGIVPAMIVAFSMVGFESRTVFIYALLAVYAAIESLILAKWGTVLPACVAGGDKSLERAGARGSEIFGYVFSRFWACNAPVLVVGLAAVIFGTTLVFAEIPTVIDSTFDVAVKLLAYALIFVLFAYNLVLIATILSRAYLIAEAKLKEAPAAASAS